VTRRNCQLRDSTHQDDLGRPVGCPR